MKFSSAVIFMILLAFQVADQRPVYDFTTEAVSPHPDDLTKAPMNIYNGSNMPNTSTASMEETTLRNGGTDTTLAVPAIVGANSTNSTTSDMGAVTEKPKFYHDETDGLMVVLLLALFIGAGFITPAVNHWRKNLTCRKQATMEEEDNVSVPNMADLPDMPPKYDDLFPL